MTNEQILELAETCGFIVWECAEEQLLKFAQAIHGNGYKEGYSEGNSAGWVEGYKCGNTGVFGEPLG
jgi:hypothetical protein